MLLVRKNGLGFMRLGFRGLGLVVFRLMEFRVKASADRFHSRILQTCLSSKSKPPIGKALYPKS